VVLRTPQIVLVVLMAGVGVDSTTGAFQNNRAFCFVSLVFLVSFFLP
jgi:hypothetical protein